MSIRSKVPSELYKSEWERIFRPNCEECNGKGEVFMRTHMGPKTMQCPDCHGSGKYISIVGENA